MSLARAILGNMGATLLSNLLALATGVLTARLLGPEGKGVYVYAFLVSYLAVNALTLGVGSANTYFIARGDRDARTTLGTTLAIVLPLGALGALGIWAFLATGWWATPHASYITVAAWSIVPLMGGAVIRHTLLGLQRYALVNWLIVAEQAIVLVLALGSLLWGRDLSRLCAPSTFWPPSRASPSRSASSCARTESPSPSTVSTGARHSTTACADTSGGWRRC